MLSLLRRGGVPAHAAGRQIAGIRRATGTLRSILASATQRRHALRWLRSLRSDYLLDAPSPWLTFDAIDYITSHVAPAATVFEYGSGGSTLFWMQLGARCTSVEHDPAWHAAVSRRLPDRRQVDYRLVQPEVLAGEDTDPSDPLAYGTADAALRRRTFRRYVSQIDEFPDGHFDVVLIDGRSRPSCVMHGASKVKAGGLLIVDNSEIEYYLARSRAFLQGYTERAFHGVIPSLHHRTCTSVFVKRAC